MFVAQVRGKSMEPVIPDGAYCLFRPAPQGSRNGLRVLVMDEGGAPNGGHYTLNRAALDRGEITISPTPTDEQYTTSADLYLDGEFRQWDSGAERASWLGARYRLSRTPTRTSV